MSTLPPEYVLGNLLQTMLSARDPRYHELLGTAFNAAWGSSCQWILSSLHTSMSMSRPEPEYALEGALYGELPDPAKIQESGFVTEFNFSIHDGGHYMTMATRVPRFRDGEVSFRLVLIEHPTLSAIIKELWEAVEFQKAVETPR